MSVYAISSAALSHLRPLVVNIVDQNVKEIRRSSNCMDSAEQKHLNYIADTMESSVETATRALDCNDIIASIKSQTAKSGSTAASSKLSLQLDEILRKQSEILQIQAHSLVTSKQHYSQQFMPGALTHTASPLTLGHTTPNTDADTPDAASAAAQPGQAQSSTAQCKDVSQPGADSSDGLNLQQIFSKLQVSVQMLSPKSDSASASPNEEKKEEIVEEEDEEDESASGRGLFETRRIWVKSLVLATHFVTAVWLTIKDEVDGQLGDGRATPKGT